MGFYVERSGEARDPRSATMSRSRGVGEMDEMEQLFEQLVGEEGGEGGEELGDFDWEGLWDSFMEGEEGGYQEGGVPQQGANRPTMFGSPIRPGGFGQANRGMNFNYY